MRHCGMGRCVAMSSPPLGSHVSVAGGVSKAFGRGEAIGCAALQVFVKNASQWVGKPLATEEVEAFRQAHLASPVGPVLAHATYLVNLCATDPDNLARSRRTLGDELDRCHRLGISGLVVHPGAHLGASEEAGLAAISHSISAIFAERPDCETRLLLEITAGQGTVLGHRLSQLATIRDATDCPERIGTCIDTCHAFAAGHRLDTDDGYESFFAEHLESFGGVTDCFHLNDSQHPAGSRKDRHANIGEGEIGPELFERLVNDPAFAEVPMVLETPMGDDDGGHRRDLERLRAFRRADRAE